jgi:hypothetical protein
MSGGKSELPEGHKLLVPRPERQEMADPARSNPGRWGEVERQNRHRRKSFASGAVQAVVFASDAAGPVLNEQRRVESG